MGRLSVSLLLALAALPAHGQHILGTTFVDLGNGQVSGHVVDINPSTGIGVSDRRCKGEP